MRSRSRQPPNYMQFIGNSKLRQKWATCLLFAIYTLNIVFKSMYMYINCIIGFFFIIQGGLRELLIFFCDIMKSDIRNTALLTQVSRSIANFAAFPQNTDKLVLYWTSLANKLFTFLSVEMKILIVLAHWYNSPRIDMWPKSDTLCWIRANQSLLFLLNAAC
jgi:hypothetical protein